jgi:hypothetical protein
MHKNTYLSKCYGGESEYLGSLKTRKLLIFLDAQNAENGEIAPNWNVSGTRDFSFADEIPIPAFPQVSELPTIRPRTSS